MPSPKSPKQDFKYSGFINLNKAADWTSHDCVARVRRLLGMKKVGHAGTLDPAATGVLPIALGKATRLLQYLPDAKAYRAVVRFGLTTDTDDLEGTVLTQRPAPQLNRSDLEPLLSQFVGEIQQVPPQYSAIQVKGQRLYDLARQGKTVEVAERTVVVHTIQIAHWQAGDFPELALDIECGAGTYIRAIARDLGSAAGTGATLASLQRTRSSGFAIEDAITLDELAEQLENDTFKPVSCADALQALPAIQLSAEYAQRWRYGQRLPFAEQLDLPLNTPLRVVEADNTFLGVGEAQHGEKAIVLSPKMVFDPVS
ncbi:MAG: tRNA pseudouridine(55) synthase TruB [Cyanobacteria bacterium J06554_6]